MITEKLLNDLEEIVNRGLEDSAIPVSRGNSIRIKHIVVRKSIISKVQHNGTIMVMRNDN